MLTFRICKKTWARWVPLRTVPGFDFIVPAGDVLFAGRPAALEKARAKLAELVAAQPWNVYGILTYEDGKRRTDQPVEGPWPLPGPTISGGGSD